MKDEVPVGSGRQAGTRRGLRLAVFGVVVAIAAALAGVAAPRAAEYTPAHLLRGTVPGPPFNAIGWIEAVVDVEVNEAGAIVKTTGLRATPGGVDVVVPSLKDWKFRPANDGTSSVSSHVLVAAMMRPAQLFDPAGGAPAADIHAPDQGVLYPRSMTRPGYPAMRIGDRAVLVEVIVSPSGSVERAAVVFEASGFDDEALRTARKWIFRPAGYKGQNVPGVAYLIFGFRTPV